MRKYIFILLVLFVSLQSCTKDETLTGSNLNTEPEAMNNIDSWLKENFTDTFNIRVFYKWNQNKVDMNRYLYPPIPDSVKVAMKAVKKVWLDTYTKVAGEDFVKKISPREFLLIGGVNLNPSGTITLGLADKGMRITFFNTDYIDIHKKEDVIRFISTIQHEYAHILNQNVPFDEESYENITPSGYTSAWSNKSTSQARELGFITNYAMFRHTEDFAEMVNIMLSNDKTEYDKIVNGITSKTAKDDIRKKEDLVVKYFASSFGIDLYELQRVAAKHINELITTNNNN